MIESFYLPFGNSNATIAIPAGTVVLDVHVDGVPVNYIVEGDIVIVDLTGIPEGARIVTVVTNIGDMESVMDLYNETYFFPVINGEKRAKIIRSLDSISFNESFAHSKVHIPSQVGKVLCGIPLQRMNFGAIDFVPVSQMIDLGTFSGMTFSPTLSMRLKYTAPVPFDPDRNKVSVKRYDGAWTTVAHNDATNRYIEFVPVPPGLYVASIPKPPGLLGQDMRGLPSRGIPSRHPGTSRHGTR